MRVLVLGAYGLIGTAITRNLLVHGHAVTGLGRSATRGKHAAPQAQWIAADISAHITPESWLPLLSGIDAVVNAAGLLQNGLHDNVARVQRDAITALIRACETSGIKAFIQISAPDAKLTSDTEFFRTKAEADKALQKSQLDWTILRPGLVLSPHAYGGTSLIRRLAAMPVIQAVMLGDAKIQTVHVQDVANAVLFALEHKLSGVDAALVEDSPHTLKSLTLDVREWLGFGAPVATVSVPLFLGRGLALAADLAGYLGWRSALRTTSLKVLAAGVLGDAKAWPALTGQTVRTLDQSLRDLPSTLQERLHARAMFLFPGLLLTLSLFWIASGVIGLLRQDEALAVIDGTLPASFGKPIVLAGGVMDILIGLALLFRPAVRFACLAAVLLSLAYLAGSALVAPQLWADPLGPMVKVFPAIALAVIVAALSEER
ncbi:SDR family oxidoreductase [Hyphomonas sp.]|uniref:SDR family oxidoreductase n=1 Tax=Hyphomonas sp. TaxID=87 RepID=UPI0032EFA6EF